MVMHSSVVYQQLYTNVHYQVLEREHQHLHANTVKRQKIVEEW